MKKEKIGIVDVGGGLRGIYAAGVLDYCLDQNITFDYGIGVSAGSANLASFLGRQPRRNKQFYAEYAFRKEYMSWDNFRKKKSYLDLDYVYGTLSNSDGESPLNYDKIMENPMEMHVVATNAKTGKAVYFDKSALSQDNYHIFKASSSIPFICPPYPIHDVLYYDGALSDPVPIKKAFEDGCSKVILLLTLPEDTIRSTSKDSLLAFLIHKEYPLAAKGLASRAIKYNESISLARTYVKAGKLLIVAPDDTCGVSTLTRNPMALSRLYVKGYRDGEKIPAFLKK